MLQYSVLQDFKQKLLPNWAPRIERCGVILADGTIVEKQNRAAMPENQFEFALEDLDGAIATWHSHPVSNANLSRDDFYFFKSWASLSHFIISRDEVRCYVVFEEEVHCIDDEEDYPPRLLEGSLPSPD